MNMQLKQALEKFNLLNIGGICWKMYGIDSYAKSAKFEEKTLKNEWRPLANTRWTKGTINWISHWPEKATIS